MLIQSLLAKPRRKVVRDVYRTYLKCTREFMKLAEECALKASADQRVTLLNCFRLQALMNEQQSIRFSFLYESKSLDWTLFKSLDEIFQRLDKGWSAAEEEALKQRNLHYRGVCQEIKDIQLKRGEFDSLTAPLKAVEQDPQYRAAREAIANRVQELRSRIAPELRRAIPILTTHPEREQT
jgi:hypothetical protein